MSKTKYVVIFISVIACVGFVAVKFDSTSKSFVQVNSILNEQNFEKITAHFTTSDIHKIRLAVSSVSKCSDGKTIKLLHDLWIGNSPFINQQNKLVYDDPLVKLDLASTLIYLEYDNRHVYEEHVNQPVYEEYILSQLHSNDEKVRFEAVNSLRVVKSVDIVKTLEALMETEESKIIVELAKSIVESERLKRPRTLY